jgi:hypothetical protein
MLCHNLLHTSIKLLSYILHKSLIVDEGTLQIICSQKGGGMRNVAETSNLFCLQRHINIHCLDANQTGALVSN